jgi:hypothetical protein
MLCLYLVLCIFEVLPCSVQQLIIVRVRILWLVEQC